MCLIGIAGLRRACPVFGVVLKDGALEVLHFVGLAVEVALSPGTRRRWGSLAGRGRRVAASRPGIAADGLACLGEELEPGVVWAAGRGRLRAIWLCSGSAEQGEQHIVWGGVFGVHLEDGALEVLDGVGLAVRSDFSCIGRRWVALLGEAAMLLPVVVEDTCDQLARLWEACAAATWDCYGGRRERWGWRCRSGSRQRCRGRFIPFEVSSHATMLPDTRGKPCGPGAT